MQKNSQDFSMQEALRLANSDAGQRLLALLKEKDDPGLRQAMQQVSAGDYSNIKDSLAQIMASPQVRQLLKEMEESHG